MTVVRARIVSCVCGAGPWKLTAQVYDANESGTLIEWPRILCATCGCEPAIIGDDPAALRAHGLVPVEDVLRGTGPSIEAARTPGPGAVVGHGQTLGSWLHHTREQACVRQTAAEDPVVRRHLASFLDGIAAFEEYLEGAPRPRRAVRDSPQA